MNKQNTKIDYFFSVLDNKTEVVDFVFLKKGECIQKPILENKPPKWTRNKYGNIYPTSEYNTSGEKI